MKGSNYSSQRELIYSTLCSVKTHPSAKWIYNKLKEDYPDLSLGTVYRNIALFKEKGMVVPVVNILGEERLDGDTSPHAHLVCTKCGKIEDTEMPEFAQKNNSTDFSADFVSVTYFGTCKKCSR